MGKKVKLFGLVTWIAETFYPDGPKHYFIAFIGDEDDYVILEQI